MNDHNAIPQVTVKGKLTYSNHPLKQFFLLMKKKLVARTFSINDLLSPYYFVIIITKHPDY